VVVQIAELVAQDMGGIEHLTENIELHLRPRVVPDPHRPTVAVPGEVVECVLGKIALAFHAVHDLDQLRAYGAGGVREPVEQAVGLVRAGGDPQRADGEAEVTQPGVAVVEVQVTSHAIREGRWSRRR
jgi:hypothetical protein